MWWDRPSRRLTATTRPFACSPASSRSSSPRPPTPGGHHTSKTLLLLGASAPIRDLKLRANAPGDARQLRADLQAWTTDALAQHRTFHDTFLFGCSAHEGIALAALGGVDEVREEIGAYVGIVVGAELRRLRVAGPAIAAVDWAAHDAPWQPPSEDEEEEEEEEEQEEEEEEEEGEEDEDEG